MQPTTLAEEKEAANALCGKREGERGLDPSPSNSKGHLPLK